MNKVTIIGGGTGTFVVLSGLKSFEGIDLGVIVSMMDSGGSTGRLRDQLGVLPPGDLRQCLVALSEASTLWRRLFLYRFENGDLEGHNFGNIFLSALEKVSDNYDEVMDTVSYVLKTKGRVVPVTYGKTHLCVEYESGKVIEGEGNIDEDNHEESRIKKAFLKPKVQVNPNALDRVHVTDVLIIGPGDLYTSILPVIITNGVKDAIIHRNPFVIYIMNMMTKSGQTHNYKASDHIEDLKHYIGKEPDLVLMNNGKVDKSIIEWYESHNEHVVINDLDETNYNVKCVEADFVDRTQIVKSNSDTLTRSILRHDSAKLAKVLKKYIL
jgi:uncharacterized cofD-like protein